MLVHMLIDHLHFLLMLLVPVAGPLLVLNLVLRLPLRVAQNVPVLPSSLKNLEFLIIKLYHFFD